MGRPRSRHKDLPPFLHRKPNGSYYFRGPIAGKLHFRALKATEREKAIAEYWDFRRSFDSGEPGTLGEIIDLYVTHPFGLNAVKAEATRKEYKRQLPIIRKLWGKEKFSLTPERALLGKGAYLRTIVFTDYLRGKNGQRGAVSANRIVRLVSRLFGFAIERSVTAYNPVDGAHYNGETPRKTAADRAGLQRTIEKAAKPVGLMLELASVTSISEGDIRLMTKTQVGELLESNRRKTGVEQEWEITPYVQSIFERAKELPGSKRSVYVFPRGDGQPYTLEQFQSAFRYARKRAGTAFQFRDIRKWNIRQAKIEGQDPQDFAAHADRRTTDRHYLNDAKRARPLK